MRTSLLFSLAALCTAASVFAEPRQISGVYPNLAMYNNERECGTGAVVPFADRLWVITYGPHLPLGSSDKLYEITPDLQQIVRPESVGGTPANRMIHRESNQLAIGPYLINKDRNVRVLKPKNMPGRLTGTARHLEDPVNKIYYATMEEGFYEVDVNTLEVTGFIKDGNKLKPEDVSMERPPQISSKLPGYHGKGLYSGQGRVVYANNGEQDPRIKIDPAIPSGALGEWQKPGDDWKLVRRNQFTEVTGPGGIYGNEKPESDPIWSMGWDYRSLILMTLHEGKWHSYRLPKGSHSYDGSHGWNTEWPRIREIGEKDLLMTMHGTFWHFPKDFTPGKSTGITPRSNYLRVIGDFALWKDRVVFGCDDTAASEFLNSERKVKGKLVPAGQSQSNLWFVKPADIDNFGPVIGRGAVWQEEDVKVGVVSEPYLFSGYEMRSLHLTHKSGEAVTFALEVDAKGDGNWQPLRKVEVPASGYQFVPFTAEEKGAWVRLTADKNAKGVTALFQYKNADKRSTETSPIFAGLAKPGDKEITGGLLHARGQNLRTLRLLSQSTDGKPVIYDLDGDLKLTAAAKAEADVKWMEEKAIIPKDVITSDAASVLYVDEKNRRWRLPKGDDAFDQSGALGDERICREVCTERDLLNVHGTFYELPAENAGGFSKMRPVATHNLRIKDYATYRGLLFFSGLPTKSQENPHILRSEDGKAALWAGVVDDLWQAGKPRGKGGPWKDTAVKAGEPSDAYLMTAYDKKSVTLSHTGAETVKLTVEVDITGSGTWVAYQTFAVEAGKPSEHQFPDAFTAYWVRVVADKDTTATATFLYE